MRKLILLALILVLGIVPALAKSPQDVTKLAQYFPADTVVFISIRTDDDFFATLDAMLEKMGTTALTPALDSASSRYVDGGDFQSVFRSWMGDTGAMVFPQMNIMRAMNGTQPITLYALEVTDMSAAKSWLDMVTSEKFSPRDKYTVIDEPDSTYYITDYSWIPKYLLKDGVLLWTMGDGTEDGKAMDVLNMSFETSLADNPDFQNALGALPEANYDLAFYTDAKTILQPLMNVAPALMGSAAQDVDMSDALAAIGPQVGGLTILDDKALTLDFAQIMDVAKLAEHGVKFGDKPPVDLDFAKYIPADSVLVMQDQDFAADTNYLLKLARGLAKVLDAQVDNLPRDARPLLQAMPPSRFIQFQLNAFKGLSGLSLDDFLSWMTSDYATFIRIVPDDALTIGVDSATVIKNTSASGASASFDASKRLLDSLSIAYTDSNQVLSVSLLDDFLQHNAAMSSDTLELQLAYNDEVFVAGSQPAVTFALNPTEDNLANDSSFQQASTYFLPDTQMLGYVNFAPITEVASTFGDDAPRIARIAALTSLFDSASLTVHYGEDGIGHVRAVLTLSD